jgi:hypothetical protein
MAIPSSEKAGSGTEFVPVPVGSHISRCVTVVDLGIQQTKFGDKEQVFLGFEVYDHRVTWKKDDVENEGPGLVHAIWTNNLYEEANLGKNLISWRGKPFTPEEKKMFDLEKLLGVPCMISVTHREYNGKTYANIESIIGCPKGIQIPDQETESTAYSSKDPSLAGNLSKLPEWLQEKVKNEKAAESPAAVPQGDAPDEYFDDIPF